MTVKGAIREINDADKMVKTLEAALTVLGSDDYNETIGISTDMAIIMIDICKNYKTMMEKAAVNVEFEECELPFK